MMLIFVLKTRNSYCNIGLTQLADKPGCLYLKFYSILMSSLKRQELGLNSFYFCCQLIAIFSSYNRVGTTIFAQMSEAPFFFFTARQSHFLLLRYIIPKMAIRMILTSVGVQLDFVHTHKLKVTAGNSALTRFNHCFYCKICTNRTKFQR